MRRALLYGTLVTLTALTTSDAGAVTGTITRLSSGSATDQQNSPAVAASNVVWTDSATPATGPSNFDIFYYNLTTAAAPLNLTNTPSEQEFLEDIDGNNVVWTHTGPGRPGDIVVYDVSTNTAATVASGTTAVHFEQPAIRGRYITFLRVTSTLNDVDLWDNLLGLPAGPVTNDPATQGRPRVGTDYVVYEDYASGNADVYGWPIATKGPAFPIATGPHSQITPDLDGNTVVYIDNFGTNNDQLFAYDLVAKTTRQLTTVASNKTLPRISGTRVVWSDDRSGNLDLYLYDLAANSEQPLVTGPGDQFLSDIDGSNVVYTSNEMGFQQVYLYAIADPPPPPPPTLPFGCDPAKTDAVGTPSSLVRSGARPVYAAGPFVADATKTYWVCVDNGIADGSQRTSQFLFSVDGYAMLTPNNFAPVTDPPRHVATRITFGGPHHAWGHERDTAGRDDSHPSTNGDSDDDDGDSDGVDDGNPKSQHEWTAALFGRQPPNSVTISIRVTK